MQNTTVKQGQSFLDMVMQETGNLSAVVPAALENDISITDDVEIGSTVAVPAGERMRKEPATASNGEFIVYPEGINYWVIEETFTVQ